MKLRLQTKKKKKPLNKPKQSERLKEKLMLRLLKSPSNSKKLFQQWKLQERPSMV